MLESDSPFSRQIPIFNDVELCSLFYFFNKFLILFFLRLKWPYLYPVCRNFWSPFGTLETSRKLWSFFFPFFFPFSFYFSIIFFHVDPLMILMSFQFQAGWLTAYQTIKLRTFPLRLFYFLIIEIINRKNNIKYNQK